MAGAQAFMEGWTRLLEELGSSGDLEISSDADDESGILTGTLHLQEGCRLDVYLRLSTAQGARLQRYSLQLMDASGRCLVRYDNANHHPELPGAPHHVHVRDHVAPVVPEPSLRSMLAGIRETFDSI